MINDKSGTNESAQIKDLKKNLGKSKVSAEQKKEFFKTLAADKVTEDQIAEIHKAIEEANKSKTSTKSKPSEATSIDSETSEFDKLAKSKDFLKFIRQEIVMGNLEEDTIIEDKEDETVRQIVANYHVWVESGRPKPQLTKETKGKIKKILSVTRVRHGGLQFIQYTKEGDSMPTGKEWKYGYAQIEQPDGSFVEDKGITVSRAPHYTIKFDKTEARKLITRCKKESINPKFYLALSNGKAIAIQHIENFTEDFDVVWAKAMKLEVV